MVRIAAGNGFKILSFYDLFFGRNKAVWTRDVDHHAPAWLLHGLAERTGVEVARLEAMTLRHFNGLAYEQLNPVGATRWIMSVGVYHRERRGFGQHFCPRCLAEDGTPFLRLRWRLAMSTVCIKHEVFLCDRCGGCGRPLAVHRQDIGSPTMPTYGARWSRCARCGHDLETDVVAATAAEIGLQAAFDRILDQGHGRVGAYDVYAHLYFEGLTALIDGMERASPRFNELPPLEMDSPASRATRLLAGAALMEDWPVRFLEKCKGMRRPYTVFTKGRSELPYWLHGVLRRELEASSAPLTSGEVDAIRSYAHRLQPIVSSKTTSLISGRDLSRRSTYRQVDTGVAELLLASLDHRIAEVVGTDRLVLLRDKVLITAGRCLSLGFEALARLEAEEFQDAHGVVSFWDGIRTPAEAKRLLRWYSRVVRPQWPNPLQTDALFVTVAGGRMSPQALGARFGLAVHKALLTANVADWKAWANPPRRRGTARYGTGA